MKINKNNRNEAMPLHRHTHIRNEAGESSTYSWLRDRVRQRNGRGGTHFASSDKNYNLAEMTTNVLFFVVCFCCCCCCWALATLLAALFFSAAHGSGKWIKSAWNAPEIPDGVYVCFKDCEHRFREHFTCFTLNVFPISSCSKLHCCWIFRFRQISYACCVRFGAEYVYLCAKYWRSNCHSTNSILST